MGQTLISKYQSPPSRQQVDDEMNTLLQTIFDCHHLRALIDFENSTKSKVVWTETVKTLFKVVLLLRDSTSNSNCDCKTEDTNNEDNTESRTGNVSTSGEELAQSKTSIDKPRTIHSDQSGQLSCRCTECTTTTANTKTISVCHLLQAAHADPSLREALLLVERFSLESRPLLSLVTPEGSLFFFRCQNCFSRGFSSFAMALPSRCNHPVCTRCLLNTSSSTERLVDLYYGTERLCRLFLCPTCGLASDILLLFNSGNRHLLLPSNHPTWRAKMVTLNLTVCNVHDYKVGYKAYVFQRFPHPPGRLYLPHQPPTDEQVIAEMDFWIDCWLDTAQRHFLDAIHDDGSAEAETLANLNVFTYLCSVGNHLNLLGINRGLERMVPDVEEEVMKGGAGNEDNQCRICFEAILPLQYYTLLDCCSHCYCSKCISTLKGQKALSSCPTCRRPIKKTLDYWHFYPQGSARKEALFAQVKCVDELLLIEEEDDEQEEVIVEDEDAEETEEVEQQQQSVKAEEEEREDAVEETKNGVGLSSLLWNLFTSCLSPNDD